VAYYTKSTRPQAVAEKYATESPSQIAAHIEIDGRYSKKGRRSATVQRRTEILKLAWFTFHGVIYDPRTEEGWPTFPDNDLAHRFLVAIRSHVKRKGFNNIVCVAAPWLSDIERDSIKPKKKYGAVQLGKDLGLTDEMRTELGIRTIWGDAPRSVMKKRERAKTAARVSAYRARTKAVKPPTKTEHAVIMLQELLAYRPMAVADIQRSAARRGLEKSGATKPGRVLQTAARRLGIVTSKDGISEGWSWSLQSVPKNRPRRKRLVFPKASSPIQKTLISSKASCSVTVCTILRDSECVTHCRPAPGEAGFGLATKVPQVTPQKPTPSTIVEREKKRHKVQWESWIEDAEADFGEVDLGEAKPWWPSLDEHEATVF
jgi:hypothetical protein